MVYVRRSGNIRKPARRTRRASVRARPVVRRKRVTRRRSYKSSPKELTHASKFALAQLDPFEPACMGAKIPDSNTMPSLANTDTDQVVRASPTSVATHLAAFAFRPTYRQAVWTATTGNTVTWDVANSANRRNYSNLIASVEAIRPVAHAIRLSCGLAPTSTTGFVHVGIAVESRFNDTGGSPAGQPQWPIDINQMTGLAHYKRFTLASLTQSPITCINKWLDDTGFRYEDPKAQTDFRGAASAPEQTTFNFLDSWGTLIVMVEGAPLNVNVLNIEHILLTECIPKKDAFILGSTAAPHSAGSMSATSVMCSETDFAHTEAQQDSYIQQGLEAFQRGAAVAGERVYNDIAVPLLGRFGHAVINTGMAMALNAVSGRGGLLGVNSNPSRLAIG